jgi:hypothetical protein
MSLSAFKEKLREKEDRERRAREIQAQWELFARKIRGIYDSDEITDKPEVIIPIIRWLLNNFEELRDEARGLIGDGIKFKEYQMDYPTRVGGEGGQSVVERYIIGAEKCQQIITAVQKVIDSLNPELFDIMVKYFWDGLPAWRITKVLRSEEVEISERTVKRRIHDIYSMAIEGLKDADINYYNLYWFRLKFECVGQKRRCNRNRNKHSDKDAA